MAQQPPSPQRRPDSLQPGDILVVVHDFDARSADELTLRKAERVELVELDDGFGDGWYLGRHLHRGGTGLFPGVYTAKLPANIAAMHSPTALPYTHSPDPTQTFQLPPAEVKTQDARPMSDSNYSQSASASLPRNSMPQPTAIYKPMVQRSIGEALGGSHNGEDSPVMNETLSVIDEHITDLSTPRQSLAPPQALTEDSESEYSSHLDRTSFLAGPETDDEENAGLTKAEVSGWDPKQVATHLRSLGVDPKHCDIFEEQEITGDVLLDMDQSFIQMKEFDFGVMGRRLKTWHKIRDFQIEVRGEEPARQNSMTPSSSSDNAGRAGSRVLSGTSILPRIPSLTPQSPGLQLRQSQQSGGQLPSPVHGQQSTNGARGSIPTGTPPSAWRASMGPDSPGRPSAAQVRDISHSRRHSSIDFGKPPNLELSSNSIASTASQHKKQLSFDRDWSGIPNTPASTNVTSPSIHSHALRKQESLDMSAESPLLTPAPNLDLDRGYFSGNEVDNRKSRNVLKKRDSMGSATHSRQSSMLDDPRRPVPGTKRHSRLSSVDSSRDPVTGITSPASKAYHSSSYKGRFRSASARGAMLKHTSSHTSSGHSPTVTNLENEQISPPANTDVSIASKMHIPAKARKLMGLRVASEAVTDTEKASASSSQNILTGSLEESPIASPADGSHTPSATSHSFDFENAETSSKSTDQMPSAGLATKPSQRSRPKTKKQTSAYTKGLLKISPEEARKQCDHHGWMKKKSSTLMTTWKPRLFILRGRRLSYYYSENDTEERGIIDISGHKVLVANSDPITTLHATITGARNSPFPSPTSGGDTTPPTPKTPTQPFFFKLVPPKAGMSRAVQFTKPTIHYFQVDSTAEGRKWMGEIMKATIMHDLTTFETTNKQKTITLARAKDRKERPPALKGIDDEVAVDDDEEDEEKEDKENAESGLNISGLELESTTLSDTIEEEKEGLSDDPATTQPTQPPVAAT